MIWQTKAAVMAICAGLPRGDIVYRLIQKKFGRLNCAPYPRLHAQREMAQWLQDASLGVDGCTVLEVGTGHLPVVPIGFFLSGAGRVITVDLNQRLDLGLCKQMLQLIAANETQRLNIRTRKIGALRKTDSWSSFRFSDVSSSGSSASTSQWQPIIHQLHALDWNTISTR